MTTAERSGPTRGGPQHIPRPDDVRPGDAPPWAELPPASRRPTLDTIRRALAAEPPSPPLIAPAPTVPEPIRASAVLAPLYEHEGEVWVVLTRRAWHLRAHRGEVSFPGGRQEPGETLWQTALREAWEEVGLDRDAPERIGELVHLSTVTSASSIVPYVGVLPGRPELKPNHHEVDQILHVPVAELLDPGIYHQERWAWNGVERPIHFFDLVGDTLWGATGSMLVDLLSRVTSQLRAAG